LKDLKPYAKSDGIRFLGGIYEEELLQVIRLKSHLFIHGHSVGGTNPSLIEAMASSNLIAAHSNQFNKAVLGKNAVYFADSKELEIIFRINYMLNLDVDSMKKGVFKSWERNFTWPAITQKYIKIITQV
jgi:rhamnosyltransferase